MAAIKLGPTGWKCCGCGEYGTGSYPNKHTYCEGNAYDKRFRAEDLADVRKVLEQHVRDNQCGARSMDSAEAFERIIGSGRWIVGNTDDRRGIVWGGAEKPPVAEPGTAEAIRAHATWQERKAAATSSDLEGLAAREAQRADDCVREVRTAAQVASAQKDAVDCSRPRAGLKCTKGTDPDKCASMMGGFGCPCDTSAVNAWVRTQMLDETLRQLRETQASGPSPRIKNAQAYSAFGSGLLRGPAEKTFTRAEVLVVLKSRKAALELAFERKENSLTEANHVMGEIDTLIAIFERME